MCKFSLFYFLCCVYLNNFILCNVRVGPDPWDYIKTETEPENSDSNVPPDLRASVKQSALPNGKVSVAEWFFKRVLAIVLNGGQIKINEDGNVDVSLQMKFHPNQWETLNEYIKSSEKPNEEMFRRSTGLIEQAIYKPSFVEKIAVTWSEYVQKLLAEYKDYMMWSFGIGAVIGVLVWLFKHMSYRHFVIVIFAFLYLYEVIISYKEAEQQEIERFKSAIDKCSWYFWKSTCDVPHPDPLVFLKHMNPLKIGIKMFTTLISEPMLALNESVNTMVHGMTDGLWFPFDKIVHGILIFTINILLICLLVMITFNFLLNIPFNLSFGLGLFNIGLKQRKRNLNLDEGRSEKQSGSADQISAATLDKILHLCSRAMETNAAHSKPVMASKSEHNRPSIQMLSTRSTTTIKRSASTGRLPIMNH